MTSIYKLVSTQPERFSGLFRAQDGKIKISQKELLRVDYCMPGLMFNKDGKRVSIPETETDHIPRDLVSLKFY